MSLHQIQNTPASLDELQRSYDELYRGWMGAHENTEQAQRMLDLLSLPAGERVQPGERLLDVGCGTGALLHVAAARGLDVVGVDISPVALEQARTRYDLTGRLLLGSGEDIPCTDASFDYVVNLGSLEHFLDPARAVQEMARVLKPQGKAALLVPNSHHVRAIYNVWKYGDIISDLQEYERFATRGEWERLLAANGLRVVGAEKYDTGMARIYRPGRELFWTLYNVLFRLFGNRWIPFNFTYTFIFVCEKSQQTHNKSHNEARA